MASQQHSSSDAELFAALSMQDLSDLEGLPRELVWMIIEYAPESVFDLRLASRSLKISVDEFAKTGQFVRELMITRRSWTNPPELVIGIETLECDSKLFELRLKFGVLTAHPSIRFAREELDNDPLECMTYALKLTKNDDVPSILDCLRECMGRRINTVRLLDLRDRTMQKAVPRLLDGILFSKLVFKQTSLSSEVGNLLMQRIMTAGVDKFELSLDASDIPDPAQFLLELSAHVSSLEVRSRLFRKTASAQNECDQEALILELFSRKVNRLNLRECVFFKPLNSESVKILRQRLPYLDKNIWFWATCEPNKDKLRYRENDHIVQVGEKSLSIIHKSRESEGLEGYV